jgi:hypothetical protein
MLATGGYLDYRQSIQKMTDKIDVLLLELAVVW